MTFPKPWLTATHYVYEMYAADGAALYVGCSRNVGPRLSQHSNGQPWWPEVARVEINSYPNQAEGLAAERERIKTLDPRHNRVHSPSQPAKGGWETRRANAARRHQRGEMCQPWTRCTDCNQARRRAAA